MIKETNCCTIQCDKCKDYLEINRDTVIIFSTIKKLTEVIEEIGWILLETGEAICKSCLKDYDILFDDEKHCINLKI